MWLKLFHYEIKPVRRFNYRKHSRYYFSIPPDVCVAVSLHFPISFET